MAARGPAPDNGGVDDESNVIAFPQAPEAIELRHLRAFVAVAEELNFGRAADRLYITQPALSRQIRTLETLLGCELLRRSTHRVELTLAGEALLDRSRPLLREVDAAISAAQSVGGELVGRIARMWEPLIRAVVADADVEEQRMAYEAVHANFSVPPERQRHARQRQRGAGAGVVRATPGPARRALPARRRVHARLRVRLPPARRRGRPGRRRRRARRGLPARARAHLPRGDRRRRGGLPLDARPRRRARARHVRRRLVGRRAGGVARCSS